MASRLGAEDFPTAERGPGRSDELVAPVKEANADEVPDCSFNCVSLRERRLLPRQFSNEFGIRQPRGMDVEHSSQDGRLDCSIFVSSSP